LKCILTEFGSFGEVMRSPKGVLFLMGEMVCWIVVVAEFCGLPSMVDTVSCESVPFVDWVLVAVCVLVVCMFLVVGEFATMFVQRELCVLSWG
jgi:hypothetical protein